MAQAAPPKKSFRMPKAVLMDVSGTLTQGTFIPNLLVPYFQKNHRAFLEVNFEDPRTKDAVNKLRVAAELDKGAPKIVANEAEKLALINSVTAYVDHCLSNNKENKPLVLYRFLVWFDGYDRDLLQTPVYQDVATQVKNWRVAMGIKLYVLSNGWSLATKKFLEKTTQGNLAALIMGYMDTELGPLQQPQTFANALNMLQEQPQSLIFLTKSVDEAKAAEAVGIQPVLVLTHQKDVEAAQTAIAQIPYVRSFNEIDFKN